MRTNPQLPDHRLQRVQQISAFGIPAPIQPASPNPKPHRPNHHHRSKKRPDPEHHSGRHPTTCDNPKYLVPLHFSCHSRFSEQRLEPSPGRSGRRHEHSQCETHQPSDHRPACRSVVLHSRSDAVSDTMGKANARRTNGAITD
ncbi:hypothetical protein [Nocardia colli]|uniref:hypothetical protein n=1 Tax=Nocardia colli TaxID=2545717 RepID=UPI0035D929BA